MLDSRMFSLVTGLPSTASAIAISSGFVRPLRRYYAGVRLLPDVHARITLVASRTGPALVGPGHRRGLSVLARAVSRLAYGSPTTPDPRGARAFAPLGVACPLRPHSRHPEFIFRSSI